MADLVEKIQEAKDAVASSKEEKSRLEGSRDTIVSQMQEEFGVKTKAGLEKKKVAAEKELKKNTIDLSNLEKELDKIMESSS